MDTEESKNKVDTSTEIRARIEQSLYTMTAPRGTPSAKLEHVVKAGGVKVWTQLKKRPSLGVILAGGAALALATVVGVGELTIGIAAGYAAYQVLREGVAPRTAAANVVHEIEKLA